MKLANSLNWFNRLAIRTKAIIAMVLVLVLAGMGTLTVLYKTGRLGTKADTTTKTITVKGTFTDAVTGKPVSNAKIMVSPSNEVAAPVYISTNSNGNYSTNITVNTADPMQDLIIIRSLTDNYPRGENTVFEQKATSATTSFSSPITPVLTQNFQLSKLPIEPKSTTPLDPISEKCRTQPPGPNDYDDFYHSGDYYGQYVNNVLFCVSIDNKYLFNTDYLKDPESMYYHFVGMANQINYIVAQTKLSYTPTMYFVDDITWVKTADGSNAAGYTAPGVKEIVFPISTLVGNSMVTHEMGHLVDWEKGFDSSISKFRCPLNNGHTKRHCYSSDSDDFVKTYSIITNITGYAKINYQEMFAEMFLSILLNDVKREKTQYAINNVLLGPYTFNIGNSLLLSTDRTDNQNANMYLYKFIANKSNLNEYYPGTISSGWGYEQIRLGKYMNSGLVSVKILDHVQRPMENTTFTLGSSATTRLKKTSGVFSDGSGDLFDTTGTAVINGTQVGDTITTDIPSPPSYYSGAVYNPIKTQVIQGSNGVKTLGYQAIGSGTIYLSDPTTNMIWSPGPAPTTLPSNSAIGVTGKITFPDGGRTASSIAKGLMSRYPTLGTIGGAVDSDPGGLAWIIGGGEYYNASTKIYVKAKITMILTGSNARSTYQPDYHCNSTTDGSRLLQKGKSMIYDCSGGPAVITTTNF